jgi:hypothetical protein
MVAVRKGTTLRSLRVIAGCSRMQTDLRAE